MANFFTKWLNRDRVGKQLNPETAPQRRWIGNGFITANAKGPESKILKLLDDCDFTRSVPSAQEWKKLSKILYNHLSIYESSVDIQRRLVGGVQIADEVEISDQTRLVVEDFIDKANIVFESQPFNSDIRGLNNFVREIVTDLLVDGMSFVEDRFVMDEDGEPTEEYIGVMMFDTDNFSYQMIIPGIYTLTYLDNQYPQADENGLYLENPFFQSLALEKNRSDPWGIPLIRGGKMLADILVAMLKAIEFQTKRFANPATWTLIQQKDMSFFEKDAAYTKIFAEKVKELKDKVEAGIKLMFNGRASDIISSMPGDVTINSKAFGQEFTNFIDHETLWKISILFCLSVGVPPTLLSIRTSGAGMQSLEFVYMFQLLMARIESIRETLKPVITQRIKNYLFSLGVNPSEVDRIVIDFDELQFLTEKEVAEIEKLKSEAESKRVEIFEQIRSVDPEAGERYAEEHNLFG